MMASKRNQDTASGKTPSVVIIGAGIAGLSAAARLIQHGVESVTILEATGRTGGRIHTIQDDCGSLIELGSEFIHGVRGNPVFKLAKDNRLLCHRREGNLTNQGRYRKLALTMDGETIDRKIVSQVFGQYYDACNKARECYHDNLGDNNDQGLGEFIRKTLEKWVTSFPPKESSMRRAVLNHCFQWENCEFGNDNIDDLSLNMYGSYETLQGSNVTIPRGYTGIIEALQAKIPNERLLLHHTVTTINYELSPSDKHPCKVLCSNGAIFLADFVVVTIPLGCLKADMKTLFSPRLPEWKETAIMNWGFGTVNKIFLLFDNLDFLPPKVENIQLMGSEMEDKDEWNISTEWVKCVTNMSIYSRSKLPLLLVWTSGAGARHVETLSDDQLMNDCHQLLTRVLKTHIPAPSGVIRSRWYTDPYTRGSYSYAPVGSSPVTLHDLAAPVYNIHNTKPLLLFAGEATHAKFFSTTHGALLSGQAQADLILESL